MILSSLNQVNKYHLMELLSKGSSDVDTSQLTGEAIPKSVTVNDEVLAGFINYQGLLEIKVTKSYEDTQVNKILALVEEAQSKKPR